MVEKSNRTYSMREDVIEWIEKFAEENDANYSDVVNRALVVYAAKVSSGEWKDPNFSDPVEQQFGKRR